MYCLHDLKDHSRHFADFLTGNCIRFLTEYYGPSTKYLGIFNLQVRCGLIQVRK